MLIRNHGEDMIFCRKNSMVMKNIFGLYNYLIVKMIFGKWNMIIIYWYHKKMT